MTIGVKIKKARIEQGMTQKELAGDKITRNMLSLIEADKASPSVDTAKYLAKGLSIPFSYLMSDDDDLLSYNKCSVIAKIKELYSNKEYSSCIKEIEALGDTDDELNYILSECYYALGKESVLNGALKSGAMLIEKALIRSNCTIYNTDHIKSGCLIYSAIASNIQAPLLDFNKRDYENIGANLTEIELYRYLIQDTDYKFKTDLYQRHINAKNFIKARRFNDALRILRQIDETKNQERYNSFVVFSIYTDIERCYREIGDYESAYRYANKRFSLLEAFKE